MKTAEVSIHAPTRGATYICITDMIRSKVSIHAPTRGATVSIHSVSLFHAEFQSTHPHGVRLPIMVFCHCQQSFNPRTHTGCDKPLRVVIIAAVEFQSTHPHGVRLVNVTIKFVTLCFNPRTHTGCDMPFLSVFLLSSVSIHAPTRGATR